MCTNFKNKKAEDGSVVVGRTMEFPPMLPWCLAALPADYEGTGSVPQGSKDPSKTWTASYGVVGMAAFGNPAWLVDGMNDAGLSAHMLYMPGYCTYQQFKGDGSDLSEVEVISFLLGTCSSLGDVREALVSVNVWGMDPGMGFVPGIHVLVHDEKDSLAIEFHPEGIRVVNNPLGVGTNAPYMEWHHTNLSNYLGLSSVDPKAVKVDDVEIAPLGQGQGIMGLPGDSSPPSRYVRALTQVSLSDQPADGHASEQLALHILNNFDITPGLINEPAPGGGMTNEVTSWSTISNLTGKRYSYRTIDDPTTYVIDLAKTDFKKAARTAPLPESGDFTAATI